MKKLIGMILALVMVFSLSVTAMAAEGSWDGTTHSGNTQNVTATYEAAQPAATFGNVYSVKLTWTDVSVTYSGGSAGTYKWNPTSLKYELVDNSEEAASWTDSGITITVANRSNDAITATASYEEVGEETLVFSGALNLGSAAIDTANGNADIDYTNTTTAGQEQTGTITGTMGGEIAASGTLGTITVTLTHE